MTASNQPKRGRGRPPTIDTEKLLDVAREVFLEHGIRATTLEVAQRAGVSEGSIFHRFKTKEGLFRAAMRFDEEDGRRMVVDALKEIQQLDLREGLIVLGTRMTEICNLALPLMMMSWSNPERGVIEHFQQRHEQDRDFHAEIRKEFAKFCEAQKNAGNLRSVDTELLASVFMGSVFHYCMHRLVTGDTTIPEGMYIRGLVDIALCGVLPEQGRPSARSSRGRSAH